MNILVVSYLFPPVNNPQSVLSARTVKYLRRLGHEVCVIAAADRGSSLNSSHGSDAELVEDAENVTYIADIKSSGLLRNVWRCAVYHEDYGQWVSQARLTAVSLHVQRNFDVVYSISAPLESNMAGMRIAKALGVPWVAHFSDPPFLSLGRKFKSPLRTYLTKADERRIFAYANGITFVNDATLQKSTVTLSRFRPKCHVVPHCFDPDLFQERDIHHCSERPMIISYVGSLYSRRHPFDVIKALDDLSACHSINSRPFELRLYGAIDRQMLQALDERSRPWLRVMGPVAYLASLRAMAESDLLLLIDMPDAENLFTPSKLIDYLAANRPILGITASNSSAAHILEEAGYEVCCPGDSNGVREVIERYRNDGSAVSPRHHAVAAKFRGDLVIRKLSDLLARCSTR